MEHDDEVAEVFARYAGDHAKVFVTKLESILGETGLHIRRGDDADELLTSLQKHVVHVIAGAPLCEGFSNMNAFLSGTNAMQKRKHLRYFVQTVLKFCPRYALMEMIPEITSEKHKEHLCATLLSLASASYQIQLYIACNSDFGAASSRERFVLVATRGGIPLPPALRPTHAHGDINHGVRWAITSRSTEMMNDRSHIEKLSPLTTLKDMLEKVGPTLCPPRKSNVRGDLHAQRIECPRKQALMDAVPLGKHACYATIPIAVRESFQWRGMKEI